VSPQLGKRIAIGIIFVGVAVMLFHYAPSYFTEDAIAKGSVVTGLLFATLGLGAIVYAYRLVFTPEKVRRIEETIGKQKVLISTPVAVALALLVGLVLMFIVMSTQR